MTHNKTYTVPNDRLIKRYTREMCETLAKQSGDASYDNPQLRNGIAHLLSLVARVEVKHRNKQYSPDQTTE